jgi:transposase-like protein
MLYIRYPLSLRPVEDLTFACGIDISHETASASGFSNQHPLERCALQALENKPETV